MPKVRLPRNNQPGGTYFTPSGKRCEIASDLTIEVDAADYAEMTKSAGVKSVGNKPSSEQGKKTASPSPKKKGKKKGKKKDKKKENETAPVSE